jgi:Ca2+-binding EF-hand superfamily protein
MIDFDKDGRISVDELKRAFVSKQNDDVIQDIMLEVDKDNDNFISSQEFNEAITSIMKKEFK